METIFEHNVTKEELIRYGATYLTRVDYIRNIGDQKTAYADIASLYANRRNDILSDKYKNLCGFYKAMGNTMYDECLPYKLH